MEKKDSKSTDTPSKGRVDGFWHTAKIIFYLILWYVLNVYFNIYNKRALNIFPAPWSVAVCQLVAGFPIFLPLWALGLRNVPRLGKDEFKILNPIAAMHTLGHVSGIVALGAGAVSFTHIVKSAEPLFTAFLGAIVLGSYFAFPVYLSLLPVCVGVALAAMTELSFTWTALIGAMTSNLACAMRGILSKPLMNQSIGENLTPENLFSVLTILALFMLLPFAAVLEGPTIVDTWNSAVESGNDPMTILKYVGLSGFYFYTYNEVAFMVLDLIDPISAAVANTIKRVAIIGVTTLVFGDQMTTMGMVGSATAIVGVLVYSLVKQRYDSKKK